MLVYYSAKTGRHRQNGLSSSVSKKILPWMRGEAREGLQAITSKIITTKLSIYPHSVLFFSVSFNQGLVVPIRLCSKACKHILDIVGLSQAE